MKTENLSTLKIHKLSKEQYDRELAAGRIDETALYLTPDPAIDMNQFVTVADIVDNLTTNVADKPLSAAQGYKLKGSVDNTLGIAMEAKNAAHNAATDASNAATAAQNAQTTANGKEAAGTAAGLINRTTKVNAADTNYTTLMARGTSLHTADTNPTVNGAICWTYG